MSEASALLTLDAIAVVGLAIWALSLFFFIATARPRPQAPSDGMGIESPGDPASGAELTSQAEVEGQPAVLSQRAARALSTGGNYPISAMKIVSRTDHEVTFEALGAAPGMMPRGARGRLSFTSAGPQRTRVTTAVWGVSSRGMRIAAAALILVGLAVLVGLYLCLRVYIVPSTNPSTRVQVVQMIQAVHFLWPPFLLIGLAGQRRKWIARYLDGLVHNLPYLGSAESESASRRA